MVHTRRSALNYGSVNTLDDLLAGEELLTMPDVAEMLGIPVTKVHDYVNGKKLVVYRKDGKKYIPAVLFSDGEMSKFITGAITVLYDGGFTEEEILAYLFTPDDSLPGRPIDALRENRGSEVKRRAQVLEY